MAKDLHEGINTRGIVDVWARYTIERWHKELDKKGIGQSGDLKKSFSHELDYSGREVQAVLFKFNMYGRFRDMGVGRGLKAYERASNKASQIGAKQGANVDYVHRGAKRFFNKPKMSQIYKLSEILAKTTGENLGVNVRDGLAGNGDMRVKL